MSSSVGKNHYVAVAKILAKAAEETELHVTPRQVSEAIAMELAALYAQGRREFNTQKFLAVPVPPLTQADL